MPFAIDTVAHRADEFGFSPLADTGIRIGCDVRRINCAERRGQRPASGIRLAALRGVATAAVADRGELRAFGDLCRIEFRVARRRSRRAGQCGNECEPDAERSEAGEADERFHGNGHTNTMHTLLFRVPTRRREGPIRTPFRLRRSKAVHSSRRASMRSACAR